MAIDQIRDVLKQNLVGVGGGEISPHQLLFNKMGEISLKIGRFEISANMCLQKALFSCWVKAH